MSARALLGDIAHAGTARLAKDEVKEMRLYSITVLLALCSSAIAALSAPSSVTSSIQGDSVLVKWKHPHGQDGDEPTHGYYVTVQEILKKLRLDAPDFVHVERSVMSVRMRGLKPASTYEIKVVAYSDKQHKASEPVIVNTKDLDLLSAERLTVVGVTATTALLRWEYEATNNVHGIQFKLFCSGVRRYKYKNNEMIEEGTEFEHTAYSNSHGWEAYYATELEPNTKYSCQVNALAGEIIGAPSTHCSFTTQYAAPVPPPTPLLESDESSFTVKLFPTVDRFGPISHYKVYAVPVFRADNEPVSAPYTPKLPLKQSLSGSVGTEAVSQSKDPVLFVVGSYKTSDFPTSLTFDGGWMKSAFKPKTHYSIVVAAFTKSDNSSEALCSLSALANPPVFISADMQEEWIMQHKPVGKRFTIIIVSTIISVALIFTLAFLVAFGSNFYKGKKRDAYFYRMNESDSSEDELYSKKQAPSHSAKKEAVPLLNLNQPVRSPTPNQTLAEWAIDNMCYNPAFEEGGHQETAMDEQASGHQLQQDTTTHQRWHDISAPPTPEVTDPMEGSSRDLYSRVKRPISPAD